MKAPSLNTILIVAVVLFATLFIRSCFDKTPPNEKIIRLDIENKQLEKQVKADSIELVMVRGKYDSLIEVSSQRITDLEKQKTPIINVIKKTPTIVNSWDREQLRRAISNW